MATRAQVIDLHTHSWCSDGTQSPADLVRTAAQAGVGVVALTDHDVTTGWDEAGRQGEELGVCVVPGIELSCQAGGISVHLLAYLPDPEHPDLATMLQRVRQHRHTRLRTMVQLLADDDYPVDYEEIVAHSGVGATLGRPHVADALVRAGVYPDRDRAFADVLHGRSRYYVRHWAPDALDAVRTVRAAGGVPVMAHPFASARGRTVSERVIQEMARAGIGTRGRSPRPRGRGPRPRRTAVRAVGVGPDRRQRLSRQRQAQPDCRAHHGPGGAGAARVAGHRRRDARGGPALTAAPPP